MLGSTDRKAGSDNWSSKVSWKKGSYSGSGSDGIDSDVVMDDS
jgi:hypothetical protein